MIVDGFESDESDHGGVAADTMKMDGRMDGRRREKTTMEGGDGVAAATRVGETPAQAEITAIKTRIAELNRRDAEALEQIERGQEQIKRDQQVRDEVTVEMPQANAELDALVVAPIPSGDDPTAWLPDELLILILLQVGWRRGCEAVCRRWRGLCQDVALKRQLREDWWEEYAAERLEPRRLHGHRGGGEVTCLAIGHNGKVYSGSKDDMVRVWSTRGGQLLQTLEGHMDWVQTLAVAQDGTLYSGSLDCTVRVWSGENSIHLRTLSGHTSYVYALAIAANGNVFSGSHDRTVRVWSGLDGTHLHTLVGHTQNVSALAASRDKVYSGSLDFTIRVWSATDGAHLQTLTGHTDIVYTLAFGPDGNLFSGSRDKTVRVWCGTDGIHLRTLRCDGTNGVHSLAVGLDGRLFIGGISGIVHTWRALDRTSRCIADYGVTYAPATVCLSAADTLYAAWDFEGDGSDDDDDEDHARGGVYIL
jgi:WD40 repeat protein